MAFLITCFRTLINTFFIVELRTFDFHHTLSISLSIHDIYFYIHGSFAFSLRLNDNRSLRRTSLRFGNTTLFTLSRVAPGSWRFSNRNPLGVALRVSLRPAVKITRSRNARRLPFLHFTSFEWIYRFSQLPRVLSLHSKYYILLLLRTNCRGAKTRVCFGEHRAEFTIFQ